MALLNNQIALLATGLGTLVFARWIYKLAENLAFFFRPSGIQRYLQPNTVNHAGETTQEPWALVTGSGSGLGRALAFCLASHGFNVVLHGSNAPKLLAVQRDLEAAHPTRSIRTLLLDAFICTQLAGPELAAKLNEVAHSFRDITLRVLVNNVGMPQARPELRPPFDKIDSFTYDELLQNASGNALFPLLLTRALYPLLIQNQPSLIINIGSWVSKGLPLAPSYGPAKAFLMASTAELQLENLIEARDIEVLGIDVLGFTGTDTIDDPPNILVPDATTYARAVVRSVGCGYPSVAPWAPHAIVFWVLEVLPRGIRRQILCSLTKSLRRQYAEKLALSRGEAEGKKTL